MGLCINVFTLTNKATAVNSKTTYSRPSLKLQRKLTDKALSKGQ